MKNFFKNFEITKCPVEGRNLLIILMVLLYLSPKTGISPIIVFLLILFINQDALKKYGIYVDNGLFSSALIEARCSEELQAHPVKIESIEKNLIRKKNLELVDDIKKFYKSKKINIKFVSEEKVFNKILELQSKKFTYKQICKYLHNRIDKHIQMVTKIEVASEYLEVSVDV